VPDDEQAKIVGLSTARVYNFDVAKLATLLETPTSLRIDEFGVAALFDRGRALPVPARRGGGPDQAQAAPGTITEAAGEEIGRNVTKAAILPTRLKPWI